MNSCAEAAGASAAARAAASVVLRIEAVMRMLPVCMRLAHVAFLTQAPV